MVEKKSHFLKSIWCQEIDKHCRQSIVDNHRWVNSWASKLWTTPHIHGDLVEQVQHDQVLNWGKGSFAETVEAVRGMPLKSHQYCFSHGEECFSARASDIEFSGLPCEENSRANFKRQYMEGRYRTVYAAWSQRHAVLKTPLIILENTPATCLIFV